MYWKDTWYFKNSIEREYKFAGRYGAKGERRREKKKPTPEQIQNQNQRNREKNMRRLIKANFSEGDCWITLKYSKGTRKEVQEVKKDLQKFIRSLRRNYKKRDVDLKYISRMEIGARGGIHIHMIVNRIDGCDKLIQSLWEHGRVNYQLIYERGGFKDLAEYIVKKPDEKQDGQLSLFEEQDRNQLIKYSCSRNLIRPEPERKEYRRRTVRKIIEEGPTPEPGFYIDKNSIVSGVNPFTGMSYLHYTEVRIKEDDP